MKYNKAIGLLLIVVGLLLGFLQPAIAAPGRPRTAKWDCYQYTAIVTTNNSIADGSKNDILTVTVTDSATGMPVSGVTIQIAIDSGKGGISTPMTDGSGVATLGLANLYATSTPLTVTVPNSCQPPTTTYFNYIPGPTNVNPPPGSPNPSYYITTIPTANADGVAQAQVQVHLTDGYNNEPAGTKVKFVITSSNSASGNALLNTSTPDSITLATQGTNATVDLPITDTSSGPVTIAAYVLVNGVWTMLGTPQTVQFVTPPPSQANSYIVAVITPKPADSSSQDEVQAVVNMIVNGAVVPVPDGTQVKFSIDTGTAVMTTTGVTTGGVATAYFISAVAGSPLIQAQVLINGVWTPLSDQTTGNPYSIIVFTIPPPVPSQSYIETVVSPVSADGIEQDVVEAVLNGITGKPVADGTVVKFIMTSPSVTMTTTDTTTGGVATAYFTSTTVDTFHVEAEILYNGVWTLLDSAGTSQTYTSIQFVPTAVDAAKSYIQVTQNFQVADGVQQDVVTVYLYDSLGHPVSGPDTVNFSVLSGLDTIYNAATQILINTNTTGGEFVSTVADSGHVKVQVMINGQLYTLSDNNTGNPYSTIQFVAGPPVKGNPNPGGGGSGGSGGGPAGTSGYTVEFVTVDFQLANGKQEDSVYAYVTDANKNPVHGVSVTFAIQTSPTSGTASSGAQIVVNAANPNDTTNDQGYVGIGVVDTVPGTVFISAVLPVLGNVPIDSSYRTITFVTEPDTANPATALIVIIPEALADGVQQTEVKAHVVDLTGAVMPNQPVTFTIDSGSGTIVTPQPVLTDANGDAYIEIISKTPGDVLITATVDGMHIINGSPARVHFAGINIYVPRVFTPNNDGTNDILKPILVGITTFHYFTVYNRWGNIIFTTQDPNQGWDGTFKGVPQPVETYLWIAEGIDENGRKVVARGMTSLVR